MRNKGQALVEYAIILVMVYIIYTFIYQYLWPGIRDLFQAIIDNAMLTH
jgi:hypothetical protein